ncbi:hypothetical protein CYMTET_24204 [Cymbomonas tetramitiformis]|uniref:Uncharacterized protein n=1 Tax=Cymbomonas tetramitiformis TaxID=36881 RepID=A0AAE0L062_9CHLO|nr:hypothetical protein CYMTET_24204 [Cymbomonas tetramitiformis]
MDHAAQQSGVDSTVLGWPFGVRAATDFAVVGSRVAHALSSPVGNTIAVNLATGAFVVGWSRELAGLAPWAVHAVAAVTLQLPLEETLELEDWCCAFVALALIAAVARVSQSVLLWAVVVTALDIVGGRGRWLVAVAAGMVSWAEGVTGKFVMNCAPLL